MTNIKDIEQNNQELYNKLIERDCKATYNNKILYEGKYNPDFNYNKIDESCVVLTFDLDNTKFITLCKENKNIDILKESLTDFNNIYNDTKLYNKLMNLANKLPLYNICEDNNINNKGDNFKKIYENFLLCQED